MPYKYKSDEQREALKIARYLIKKRHFNTAESILSDIKHPASKKMLAYIKKQRKLGKRYGRPDEQPAEKPIEIDRHGIRLPLSTFISFIPIAGLGVIALVLMLTTNDASELVRNIAIGAFFTWIIATAFNFVFENLPAIQMKKIEKDGKTIHRNEQLNLEVVWETEEAV